MAAVRAVEELARRMDHDLGRRVPRLDGNGHRWNRLDRRQRSMVGVVFKRGDRAVDFIDHVGVLAVRMKREVPRAGPILELGRRGTLGVSLPSWALNL